VEQMPNYLQWISKVLPLTYAVRGLRDIMLTGQNLIDTSFELIVLVAFAVAISLIAGFTYKRG
jgi:ABC-2 type transport system permease protein